MLRSLLIIIALSTSCSMITNALFKLNSSPAAFTCSADFVLHHNKSEMDLLLGYTFSENTGFLSITGNLTANNQSIPVARKVSFQYQNDKENYVLKSIKSLRFPEDMTTEEMVESLLPQFFIAPDKEIHLRIALQPGKQYLFSSDTLPAYLCKGT